MRTEIPITNMFSAACYQFVRSIGKDTLHPVPSIDEGSNVKPFQVVIKTTKRKFIFWEKASFRPTDFQITDVMTDESPLKIQLARKTLTKYKRNTKLSLKGKFGADLCKELLDVELEAKDSIDLSIQFDQVIKTEALEPSLLTELNKRYINMDHQLIRGIKVNKHKTLCLITGVASLDKGGTIHRVTEFDASASFKEKLLRDASASGETTYDKDRNLGLPPGTPVAYNIHELNVDINKGSIQLVLTTGSHGSFCSCVGYDEVDATAAPGTAGKDAGFEARQQLEADMKHAVEIFRPMFQLADAEREQIKEDLLFYLSMPRDITLLADIIRSSDDGQMVLKASEVEGKLLSEKTHWIRLLTAAGFTQQSDKLVPPSSDNPMVECIGLLLDAASLLEDETLELIRCCPADVAEALCSVLKDGIRGKAVSDPAVVKPVLANPTVQKLLLDLQFRVEEAEIDAPAELTGAVDGTYWLVLGLWGKSFVSM